MPSIGSFTIIRNESPWIAAHLLMWLPWLDEIVFYDGNSTDGTLEIIENIQRVNVNGGKIKLFKNKDPRNLKDDYVRVFDDCLHSLSTDLAFFLHPDMLPSKVHKNLEHLDGVVSASVAMRSFAGEPGGELYEIKGRGEMWKNIYRLRRPDLGVHYFGHYGTAEEDCYFSAITGDEHIHHGQNFDRYPYGIEPAGIEVLHFSDVRTYERRLGRMKSCLENQGYARNVIDDIAKEHPRVTLKDGNGLSFIPAKYFVMTVTDLIPKQISGIEAHCQWLLNPSVVSNLIYGSTNNYELKKGHLTNYCTIGNNCGDCYGNTGSFE